MNAMKSSSRNSCFLSSPRIFLVAVFFAVLAMPTAATAQTCSLYDKDCGSINTQCVFDFDYKEKEEELAEFKKFFQKQIDEGEITEEEWRKDTDKEGKCVPGYSEPLSFCRTQSDCAAGTLCSTPFDDKKFYASFSPHGDFYGFCYKSGAAIPGVTETFQPIEANLEIPIPFVDLSAPVRDGEHITVPFLAQYISGVYRFLISIVGVVAGVFLLIGGFQYATAGGDKTRVESGKKRITNAMMGLILAFGSYIILYTINPKLLEFEDLELLAVNTRDFGGEHSGSDWDGVVPAGVIEPGIPTGNVPLIKQGDFSSKPEWVYLNSNRPPVCDQSTISSSGCGIVSAAMVTAFYQKSGKEGATTLVKTLKELSTQNGHRTCNSSCSTCSGTKSSFFTDQNIWTSLGLKGTHIASGKSGGQLKNKEKVITALREGKPVVVHVKKGIFTENGHFILVTGINSKGNLTVNDPARRNTYTHTSPKSGIAIPGGPYKNDDIPPDLVWDSAINAYVIEPM